MVKYLESIIIRKCFVIIILWHFHWLLYNIIISIDIEFRKFEELWISSDGKSPKGKYNITDSSLYLENIYLDRAERIEFGKRT